MNEEGLPLFITILIAAAIIGVFIIAAAVLGSVLGASL